MASIPGREGAIALHPHNKKYRNGSIFRSLKFLTVYWDLLCPECVCSRGYAPSSTGGAYSAPLNPLAGERGLAAPPQKPQPAVGLRRRFRPFGPQGPIRVSLCQLPPEQISPALNKFGLTPLQDCGHNPTDHNNST